MRHKDPKAGKPWGLVLMGGGARGLAHIGVLQSLRSHHLEPGIIVGTSMGALVGGFYASGIAPSELEKLTVELNKNALFNKTPFSRRPQNMAAFFEGLVLGTRTDKLLRSLGVERQDRIEAVLERFVGNRRIEDLPIPFACNAVDILTGREVVFTRGLLRKALRATTAFPLVFEPARSQGALFVDGGLLNNVPVEAARALGARRVIVPDSHRPLKRIPAASLRNIFQLLNRVSATVLANSTEGRLEQADLVYRIDADV